MMINGKLQNDKIIIDKQKDIGRLYNKSNFGKIIRDNKLELDLVEGLLLSEEEKIEIHDNKTLVGFKQLVELAAKKIEDFEIKYLVFKDLRKRGHSVKIFTDLKDIEYIIGKKDDVKKFISVFSERDYFNLLNTINFTEYAKKKNGVLWYAIVDEEGDITYYEVAKKQLNGKIQSNKYKKMKGLFLKDRVIIFDTVASRDLFEKEFYGKFFGDGLQLSFVEALYLSEKNLIDFFDVNGKEIKKEKIQKIAYKLQPDIKIRLAVFKELKRSGLIVKTGFKFGTHFRVYKKNPNETHAEYLVHVVEKDFKSIWSEISRAVRLAHSVNKDILFAGVNKKIEYIGFGRLRP